MTRRVAIFPRLTVTTGGDVRRLWRHAEATGWDAAWVTDHFPTMFLPRDARALLDRFMSEVAPTFR